MIRGSGNSITENEKGAASFLLDSCVCVCMCACWAFVICGGKGGVHPRRLPGGAPGLGRASRRRGSSVKRLSV